MAISNHRLVAPEDGQVVFRWRDSEHKNKKRLMRLVLGEFLRRFFLHVLPRGFVRIRHFGFFAHRRRAKLLPLCFTPLAVTARPETGSAGQRFLPRGRSGHVHGVEARWPWSRDSRPPKRDCVLLHRSVNDYELLLDISNCFRVGTPALEFREFGP